MKRTAWIRGTTAQWMIAVVVGVGVAATGLSGAEAPAGSNPSDLAISLTAQKVVKGPDGKEVLQAAERAFPGEIVQYDAHYLNKGQQPVRNVEPTLPIPRGMTYLADSAKPAPAQASLDGKKFEPIPLKRKVTLPDGTVEEREVPATEYRALRWVVGSMEAGGQTTVVARAKIVPTQP